MHSSPDAPLHSSCFTTPSEQGLPPLSKLIAQQLLVLKYQRHSHVLGLSLFVGVRTKMHLLWGHPNNDDMFIVSLGAIGLRSVPVSRCPVAPVVMPTYLWCEVSLPLGHRRIGRRPARRPM